MKLLYHQIWHEDVPSVGEVKGRGLYRSRAVLQFNKAVHEQLGYHLPATWQL